MPPLFAPGITDAHASIEFDHVTYHYPAASQAALHSITLTIETGEFVLVCGPSGGGKSTLLRAINGLVPHFYGGTWSGRVLVAGHDTRTTQPRDLAEHVGFVFQDPDAQFVVDVVEDELAFAMENAGLPQQIMRRRIEEALDQVEIAHLRHRQLSSLSGGERQRVAIAAALTVQPRILLLDEPTSQLDPHTAEEVLTVLHKLNADLGLTIVLSEHRLERVVQYVDRVLYIEKQQASQAPFASHSAPVFAPPRTILRTMPHPPPLAAVARLFDWEPLPLTIKQGRNHVRNMQAQVRHQKVSGGLKAGGDGLKPEETTLRDLRSVRGSSNSRPLLQAQNLHAAYHGAPALQGVDLTLHAGEVLAIMGRNGSGKTTLLRHLVGLSRPARGRVLLDGQDIAGRAVEELAQQIGYVPQNPADLLYHNTLLDELRWTLGNHGLPADNERMHATLRSLGIDHLAAVHPRDLSGGEAQRAAFATMLVAHPRVLLLDEPTRGLDYAAKQSLADLLKAQAAAGRGIVLVSHDVEFVALCADRIVLLGEGEVVVQGTPAVVLGDSLLFSTQVSKLFPQTDWLTVADVAEGLAIAAAE